MSMTYEQASPDYYLARAAQKEAYAAKLIENTNGVRVDPATGLPVGGAFTHDQKDAAMAADLLQEATELRRLAANLGGGTEPAPGAPIVQATPTTNSVGFVWTLAPGGGVDVGTTISEVAPGNGHGVTLGPGVRSAPITGLTSGTTYQFLFTVVGAGGESNVTVTVATLPDVVAPTGLSVAGSSSGTAGDNVGTLTVPWPSGTAVGDTLVFVYSRDTGVLSGTAFGPIDTMTEEPRARIGTADGAHVVRVYTLPVTTANVALGESKFRSDALDSGTVVRVFRATGGPMSVADAAVSTSSATAPSVAGVAGGILVYVSTFAPSPNPTTGRTATAPAGMTEISDAGTTAGYHYQHVATLALVATGPTGTKVNSATGATSWVNSVAFVLAPGGGDPAVTAFAPSTTVLNGTTVRIEGDIVGNFDRVTWDVIGDGAGALSADAIDTHHVVIDIARQQSAFTVTVDARAQLAGVTSAWTSWGPFTIAGTGTTPGSKVPFAGPITVAGDHTFTPPGALTIPGSGPHAGRLGIYDKVITGAPWTTGAQASNVDLRDGEETLATCIVIANCTIDGGAAGAQGLFSRWVDVYGLEVIHSGGVSPDNSTPDGSFQAHFVYGSSGRYRDVNLRDAVNDPDPGPRPYGWHFRRGDGVPIDLELYNCHDYTNGNCMIGGSQIKRFIYDGGSKLGGGEWIIGGLSGGDHIVATIRNVQFNRLRSMGNWSVGLTYENCTARVHDNRAIGRVNLAGLTVTG